MDSANSTFEEQLSSLEGVVDELERGEIGLDAALAQFERGITLLKQCHATLRKAELRIEKLTGVDASGNPIVEPFASSSAVGEESPAKAKKPRKNKSLPEPDSTELDSETGLF
jgi:exodeoxyribonuclease VII small subunit